MSTLGRTCYGWSISPNTDGYGHYASGSWFFWEFRFYLICTIEGMSII